MGLFTPIWMKRLTFDQRKKALEKVQQLEGKKLIKAATEAPDDIVRRIAIVKLTDQEALRKAARKDETNGICAYGKLTGEIDYADFALNAAAYTVRMTAVNKLTDQTVLSEVARKDVSCAVRKAAVKKLTDQAELAKVVRSERDQELRRNAVEKMTDQAVLKKIALEDKDETVKKAARGRLTDQTLAEIALQEDGGWWAFVKMAGEIDYTYYAMNAKSEYVREEAMKRMSVPPLTMGFYREYQARFPKDRFSILVEPLKKLALAGDADAVEELGGWLKKPDIAWLAAVTLKEVYAETREETIRGYCGRYGGGHSDYILHEGCTNEEHTDKYDNVHLDLQ